MRRRVAGNSRRARKRPPHRHDRALAGPGKPRNPDDTAHVRNVGGHCRHAVQQRDTAYHGRRSRRRTAARRMDGRGSSADRNPAVRRRHGYDRGEWSAAAVRVRRPQVVREDHRLGGHRCRIARTRARRAAVQEGAGLHRPDVAHRRGGSELPQPRFPHHGAGRDPGRTRAAFGRRGIRPRRGEQGPARRGGGGWRRQQRRPCETPRRAGGARRGYAGHHPRDRAAAPRLPRLRLRGADRRGRPEPGRRGAT